MANPTDDTGQRGHISPRHCWVRYGSLISPGVLLDWRKTRHGQWEAWVIYATGGGMSPVTVTQQWVPAAHVKPLEE